MKQNLGIGFPMSLKKCAARFWVREIVVVEAVAARGSADGGNRTPGIVGSRGCLSIYDNGQMLGKHEGRSEKPQACHLSSPSD